MRRLFAFGKDRGRRFGMINFYFAYKYVYDEILKSIVNGELDKEGFLLSEKEYCEKFDVSLTTVRRALEQLKQEGIVEKIKGKGTAVSRLVRRIKLPPNKYIGVLMVPFAEQPTIAEQKYHYFNKYAQKIYKSIYSELRNDYNLLIDTISISEMEEKFPKSVLYQADKILILGETQKQTIEYLHGMGKCLLVYNYFDFDVQVCRVNNDEREQYKRAVDYLLQHGHNRIASINGINNFSESLERYLGYQDALILNEECIDTQYVRWGNMTPESGYYMAKELMQLPTPPTAIICVNDGVAMGAYDALTEAGYRVPEDVVLIGHDNSEFDDPKYVFTTIDPCYEKVGKLLAQKLRRNTWIDDQSISESQLIIR